MTKEEIDKIEEWTKYEVIVSPDNPDEHRIYFKPDIVLRDSRNYMLCDESKMREFLASYLRRIAAHLEA